MKYTEADKLRKRKPPLGLIPRHLWQNKKNAERLNDVSEAIGRYVKAGLRIPIEWLEEYQDLQ